jgi:energy-coupling factor transport system permease protein
LRQLFKNFDPRTKLAIVAGLSSIAVFIQHVYVLLFILILSVVLSMLFYGNLLVTLKKTKNIWYLFIAIVLLQSIFTREGRSLLEIGSFTFLTTGGLLKGVEFFLRISIIIFSATIVASSGYREIVQGFVQMRLPYEIAFMISVGIRFLPLLRDEFKDVLTAIQLRGIDIKRITIKKKIKIYSYIFMPIIAGAVKKAYQLSIAMEIRAFRAYPKRTSYLILTLRLSDYLIIILALLFTVAIFIIYYVFKFPGRII